MEERLMSEIGTLTGEDPAERVEMALGQPITSREQNPERKLQVGKAQNHLHHRQAARNSKSASDYYTLYLFI